MSGKAAIENPLSALPLSSVSMTHVGRSDFRV
jgi:hypothetical protein